MGLFIPWRLLYGRTKETAFVQGPAQTIEGRSQFKQAPALYREHRIYRQEGKATKLFQALLAMKRVFDSDARWKSVKTELEALIEEYADVVKLSFIDFPENWKDVL